MCSWVSPTRHNKKTTFRKINRCTQKLSKHPWGDVVELKKKKERKKKKIERKKERRRKVWSNKPERKKLSFFESVRDLLINLRYISFVHVVTGSSLSFDETQWTFLLFQFIAVMWFQSFYTDLWARKWSPKTRCLSHLLMLSLRVKFKSKKIGSEW